MTNNTLQKEFIRNLLGGKMLVFRVSASKGKRWRVMLDKDGSRSVYID